MGTMTTKTRSNGFPTLAMAPHSSNNGNSESNKINKKPQDLSSFGGSDWTLNQNIWMSVGRPAGSRRDKMDSTTDCSDSSPTTGSGPTQFNTFPEPESGPGPWPHRGVWNPANTSPNTVSPIHAKNFQFGYYDRASNHALLLRQSISHGPSSLQNRNTPPGPVESPTTTLRYGSVVGGPAGEERRGSAMYGAPGSSPFGPDTLGLNRRNSADPSAVVAPTRHGGFSGRQPETNTSTLTSSFGELAPYSYPTGAHAQSQHQRLSISSASIPMAPEPSRGQNIPLSNDNLPVDMGETFHRAILDTTEPLNGYMSNGYGSSASQSIQPSPSSQPWQQEISNGTRNLGHGAHHDAWAEPPHAAYPSAKRGSVERSSPAGNSYQSSFHSPRTFSGGLNPRTDPWHRPAQRNQNMSQDLDRQQHSSQYLHQPPGIYPPFITPPIPEFSASYDAYVQNLSFRTQIPPTGYGAQANYMGVSSVFRPSGVKDLSQSARSQLLEEFRSLNKSNKRYELKDIYGHIVEFSGDQHGSRFIQDKLVVANSEEKEHVFREIESNAIQLMKDVFGNYVIQKFFEHGNQVQKKLLAAQMKGKVCDLSIQMYSCRVVQKALEHVLVEQQQDIVEELRSNILQVAKDPHGNHVVQKVIAMFPPLCVPFVMKAFNGQIDQIAMHSYACRVIQRMLEYGTHVEKKTLMVDIHNCAARLMTDQYGNYVIQHIISNGEPKDRSIMIQHVIDRLLVLSKHKYASNVVEKCIQHGTADERRALRTKLGTQTVDGEDPLELLMTDQYGNYVIQKLIGRLEGEEQIKFVIEIRALIPRLRGRCVGRQNAAVERLAVVTEAIAIPQASTNNLGGGAATTGTAPSTPNLAVGVNSAVPTPPLTTEQNSPQSTSPPSTSISTADEAGEESKTDQLPLPRKTSLSPVHVQDN
ncbi:putative pumilio domain-containing protein [Rosellinia necatrix]|uniref:Putative pumilio domain-containing protein n=1 Tax=Rosellinia necatrix TaxID=77044 RepID=A0A1W2TH30_ROSNE|nr:putative pumilio domain-containing protein [Rosellinia necatrix]